MTSHQVAFRYTKKYGTDKLRVLTLVKNRGKGGAVRMVRSKRSKNNMCDCSTEAALWKCFWFFYCYLCHFLSHLKGTMSSRGKFILMADADGATKFSDIEKVEAGLHDLNPKPVWQCSLFILVSHIHV